MGWDLYLKEKECPTCKRGDEIGSWGYTYNTSPMLRKAGLVVQDMEGQTGAECARRIGEATEKMRNDSATYRAMNPENGWGSYDGVLAVLDKIRLTCLAHPESTMRGWF